MTVRLVTVGLQILPTGPGVKRPGLLLEWRQTAGAWEGRVVYAASLREQRWASVEEWIASDLLSAGP